VSAVASPTAGLPQRRLRRPALGASEAAFAALLLLGFLVVLYETRRLSFFGDEWDFLLDRRGLSADVLLRPHGPHLVVGPVLIYKILLQVFGAGSYLPFRVLAALDLVLVALVLGIVCRRLWGPWWGLAPVLLFIALGPGAVTLLWPFQVGYAVAVAAGLLALLALDTRGRHGDLLACLALLVSLASGSQGVGFVVGAAVMLVMRGDYRRRAWVVLMPVVLYGLWYLDYGRQASETHLSLWPTSLSYGMQSLSATLAGGSGLSSVQPTGVLDVTFGVPMAVAVLAGLGIALWRGFRPRSLFWGAAATLVVIWLAASMSNFGVYSRPPSDPRYLSSNVALLLVCLCVAVPRPRALMRGGIIAVGIVLAVVVATNGDQYGRTHYDLQTADIAARAELGALLILRDVVPPQFSPAQAGDPAQLASVSAGPFFAAASAFGMDADSVSQLLRQSQTDRERADNVLERGGITVGPTSKAGPAATIPLTVLGGTARGIGRCRVLGSQPLAVQAPPGRYALTAARRSAVRVTMGRFASGFDTQVGSVAAGQSELISVLADRAAQVKWRMMLSGAGARVCAMPSG
jgi:hypothetical protein